MFQHAQIHSGPRLKQRQRALPFWPAAALLLPIMLLVPGLFSASLVLGADPEQGGAAGEPDPIKGLEGLGFSVAPKGGGKARTSLFGVTGEGYKFVYVFDRSGSMGGSGRTALRAVKAELLASLKNLDTVHQFQIIFYNERPVLFNPTGTPGKLAFATEQNKQRVVRFLDTITADGGTEHEDALRMAIAMHPDVIFFLTDGDEPKLTPQQLQKIERWAAGTRINAIEFGSGPQPDSNGFLVQLARQNGGQYAYVDITKLPSSQR